MREMESVYKEIQKRLDELSAQGASEEAVRRVIQEVMMEYNANLGKQKEPSEPQTAEDYLMLAGETENEVQKRKYLEKALKLDPNCYDATCELLQLRYAHDPMKLVKETGKALEKADEHMQEEGYFEDMGDFWLIFETRPYMRMKHFYMRVLAELGMIGQAIREAERMLELCENDNLGVRYNLMSYYALTVREEEAKKLYEHYDEEELARFLLPLSELYYRNNELRKASDLVRKVNRENKDFKRFLKMLEKGDIGELAAGFDDAEYYQIGDMSELAACFLDCPSLYMNSDMYAEWALGVLQK